MLSAGILFVATLFSSELQVSGIFSAPNYTEIAATIVEHRPLQNLPHVFENFLTQLPEEVLVYFFCSPESSYLINSELKSTKLNKERVVFVENYFGGLGPVTKMSKSVYNRLLLDHTFWSYFQQKQKSAVLVFESDAFLCENPSRTLRDFLHFGYIGAPWVTRSCKTCKMKRLNHARNKDSLPIPVGNSGLSIMNTEIMLKVTSLYVKKRTRRLAVTTLLKGGCDVYISTILQDSKFKFLFRNIGVASVEISRLFSVESLHDDFYIPFGGHGPCAFANELRSTCPQASKACTQLRQNKHSA